ncbi:MAG: formate/nitrite transporter family protein [Gemmatimonadetes bacterium]|nr:formate/nitrite transporter family protein [Gemmatimonadota bacterium]
MSVAPTPSEIFRRSANEGERRLDQSLLELVSTAFIAGFTIIFGIVALGIVHAAVEPQAGQIARIAGALAFAPGVVFLIVGRAELFTENFFDPAAAVVQRRESRPVRQLMRLWAVTFVLNLIGGTLFALVFAVPGVLPEGAPEALRRVAEEIAARGAWAGFASAVVGGALVALLSFFLAAVNGVGSRIAMAYLVGFLLAVGPFDHVTVTVLHVFVGILFGAGIDLGTVAVIMAISTAGNLVGGVGLVTLSHVAQARGADESGE